MMTDPHFVLSELHRRVANLIRLGVIHEIDYEQARVTVQLGKITTDWLPWLTAQAGTDRNWHPPSVGEQVVLLSPQGDYSQGVVLHGIYQAQCPAPANTPDQTHYRNADGSHYTYDRPTHTLTVNVIPEGALTVKVGETQLRLKKGQMTLTACEHLRLNAPTITLNGSVEGL